MLLSTRKARWPANVYIHHRTIEREMAVAMEIIDQLSTYINVYVDNYQNNIYF